MLRTSRVTAPHWKELDDELARVCPSKETPCSSLVFFCEPLSSLSGRAVRLDALDVELIGASVVTSGVNVGGGFRLYLSSVTSLPLLGIIIH